MITEKPIIDLIPQFAQCKNYVDRLVFWQNHDLTEKLHYNIIHNFELWYPAEGPLVQHSRPISAFTIAPFTEDEVHQFVKWALHVRPSMPNAPVSYTKLRYEFENRYYSIGRKIDRKEYLIHCQNKIDRLIENRDWINADQENTGLEDQVLNLALRTHFFARLKSGLEPDLTDHIRVGDAELDWKVIDTYLYTDALYNYAVFLEKFNPDECLPEQVRNISEPIVTQSKPSQVVIDTVPKRFFDLFEPGSNPEECIDALRRFDSSIISETGRWIGGKGSKAVLVAWIDRLIQCGKIKPTVNDKHLAQLLNDHFPDLNLGRDARIFTQPSKDYEQYKADFAALILH